MHKMSAFYELGIGWLCVKISFKNGFIWFLVLQQLSVRQSCEIAIKTSFNGFGPNH